MPIDQTITRESESPKAATQGLCQNHIIDHNVAEGGTS